MCNGKSGTTGFTATLPEEKTETGTWSVGGSPGQGFYRVTVASFAIPLATGLRGDMTGTGPHGEPEEVEGTGDAHFISIGGKEILEGKERTSTACTGNAAEPTAAPGNLCVYATQMENLALYSEAIKTAGALPQAAEPMSVGSTGATALFGVSDATEPVDATGTWAVTAP